MSGAFKFDEDDLEVLLAPAYLDDPIGTEQQVENFVSKLELAINEYPISKNDPPIGDQKKQLKKAQKAVESVYKELLNPGGTLKYLKDSYAYLNDPFFCPPEGEQLQETLGRIGWMIDNLLSELKNKRATKLPESVHRFTTVLVIRYFFEFGRFPEIAARKDNDSTIEHPFTHFLDAGFDALVAEGHLDIHDRPKDTKYLIKKSVERFQFHLAAHLAGEKAKSQET